MSTPLSPVQFGMLPHRPKVETDVDTRMQREAFSTRRVRLDALPIRATQTKMDADQVEAYTARPLSASNRGRYGERPELIRRGDEHVVWNGHHRIAAALRRGQRTMTVDYQDLEKR